MPEHNQQQIQIKADDQTLKGHYANALMVGHSAEEFVLDFIFTQQPAPTLVSRIITNPIHMKRMLVALQENVSNYEKINGDIVIGSGGENKNTFGFQV